MVSEKLVQVGYLTNQIDLVLANQDQVEFVFLCGIRKAGASRIFDQSD